MMPTQEPEEDLSQYEVQPVANEAPVKANKEATVQASEEEDLSQYEVKPEGTIEKYARKGGQLGLDVFENFLGSQGALRNLLISGLEKGAQGIYGATIGGEFPGLKEAAEKRRGESVTAETLKEKEEDIFGEYFKPRNESEKAAREIAGDVGAFVSPIPGMGGMNAIRAIGTALFGQGAKQVSKLFTNDETKQNVSKLGANFLFDLMTRRMRGVTAKHYIDDLYNTERTVVPQGTRTTATTLEHEANAVLHDVQLSNVRPASASLVERTAQQVASDIQNGEIGVEQLLLQKRRLNEIRGDPSLHHHELPLLNRLSRAVENEIQHYGHSLNADPMFLPAHIAANEAHGAMAASRTVTNYIRRHIPVSASHFVFTILGEAATGHAAAIPGTVAATAGLGAVLKTGEMLYRVMASPTLRHHYLDVLRNASLENAVGVSKAIHKLDKAVKEEGLDEEFSASSEAEHESSDR